MTPTREPHDPVERDDDLTAEATTSVDASLAQLHQDMGADLGSVLDLDTGLHEILLAGHHRDIGTDLAGVLDLTAGLAAILPKTAHNQPKARNAESGITPGQNQV